MAYISSSKNLHYINDLSVFDYIWVNNVFSFDESQFFSIIQIISTINKFLFYVNFTMSSKTISLSFQKGNEIKIYILKDVPHIMCAIGVVGR